MSFGWAYSESVCVFQTIVFGSLFRKVSLRTLGPILIVSEMCIYVAPSPLPWHRNCLLIIMDHLSEAQK